MEGRKTDIFPRHLSEEVVKLEYPQHFKYIAGNSHVKAFVLYANDQNKIYFAKRRVDGRHMKHINSIGKECQKFDRFTPTKIHWAALAKRFGRPALADDGYKYIDRRTGFKIGNCFLVKCFFTFGQRTVKRGTAHVIQTLNIPLLFYLATRNVKRFVSVEDGLFPLESIYSYDRRILTTNQCFRIPAGTTYFLLTVQKNFFSLDVVDESLQLQMPYVDPVQTRVVELQEDPYLSMRTPHIEDDSDEEIGEPEKEENGKVPEEIPEPEILECVPDWTWFSEALERPLSTPAMVRRPSTPAMERPRSAPAMTRPPSTPVAESITAFERYLFNSPMQSHPSTPVVERPPSTPVAESIAAIEKFLFNSPMQSHPSTLVMERPLFTPSTESPAAIERPPSTPVMDRFLFTSPIQSYPSTPVMDRSMFASPSDRTSFTPTAESSVAMERPLLTPAMTRPLLTPTAECPPAMYRPLSTPVAESPAAMERLTGASVRFPFSSPRQSHPSTPVMAKYLFTPPMDRPPYTATAESTAAVVRPPSTPVMERSLFTPVGEGSASTPVSLNEVMQINTPDFLRTDNDMLNQASVSQFQRHFNHNFLQPTRRFANVLLPSRYFVLWYQMSKYKVYGHPRQSLDVSPVQDYGQTTQRAHTMNCGMSMDTDDS